ncbi:MAG: HEAT repeat domain-containing protein, partial [Lentisphaerota bacterium]
KSQLQPLEFESIRNDTLDALLRQNQLPADLGRQIRKMFNDPGQNAIWRDYCLQHVQPFCEARWKTSQPVTDDPEWAAITNAYWWATRETDGTIAGTALIGMRMVAGKYPALSKEQVAQRALALAMDDACGEPSRITALRICGQMGQQAVVPQARVLAQTGQSLLLRCAAMATLGDLGEQADMELLQSFSATPDQRVRGIAASALKRLRGRLAKTDQALQ